MEALSSAESSAMIAVRMAAHNLSIRTRIHRTLPSPIKISTEQLLKGGPTFQKAEKPKKKVHFNIDENQCVKASVHEYECDNNGESNFTANDQMNLTVQATLEGRRFYRLHRKTVIQLERSHQESSTYHWIPDVHETEFYRQWAASDARGLERKMPRQQIFSEERLRHTTAVLRCQKEVFRMKANERRTTEALRQTSLDFSHRSRVFAFHMAAGDAVLARQYSAVGESVAARCA
jgi:hypothetical protein